MDSIIRADIFFFITTIIAIFLAILIGIALFYIIRIIADIREISRTARLKSKDISDDIKSIRSEVRSELMKESSVIAAIITIIRGFFRRRKTRLYKK